MATARAHLAPPSHPRHHYPRAWRPQRSIVVARVVLWGWVGPCGRHAGSPTVLPLHAKIMTREAPPISSHQHGDRKGPPGPTQPPSPPLSTGLAAPTEYSSGEGGAMGMGGPLRSPCWITNRSPPTRQNHDERSPTHQAEQASPYASASLRSRSAFR